MCNHRAFSYRRFPRTANPTSWEVQQFPDDVQLSAPLDSVPYGSVAANRQRCSEIVSSGERGINAWESTRNAKSEAENGERTEARFFSR